jgi:phospholipid/cholesterol/gamma-HCH transport system substrate-binding protein
METRARYALVGSVVLLIIGIFILTLFWLSREREEAGSNLYLIYFRKFSLSGLAVNSWVTMRGIKVGAVESLQISPKDIELIKVAVRLQKDTPVKQDTEAVIERNLLTGLASIDLVKSTQESPLLTETDDESYPVIPEGKTALGSIQDNLPQLFDKLSQLVTRFNAVFSPENEKAFSETLANARVVSQTLAAHKDKLGAAIDDLSSAASESRTLIRDLDKHGTEAAQAFTRAAQVMSLEISRAGQSFAGMAESLRTTLQGYQDPAALIRGRSPAQRGPGEEKR